MATLIDPQLATTGNLMWTQEIAPLVQPVSLQSGNRNLQEMVESTPIQSLSTIVRSDDSDSLTQEEKQLQEQIKRLQEEKKRKAQEQKEKEEEQRRIKEYEKELQEGGPMEKHGEHWYHPGEKESWSDTFIEEEEDIEKHLMSFWGWLTYIGGLLWDILLILRNMSMGFFDSGKSFDEAFALLDKDYHQTEWLSEETLQMIGDERDTYMVYWDFSARGPSIFWDWWKGRVNHFKEIEPVPLVENLVLFILVTVLNAPGKFSIFSPIFTGWSPTVLTTNCVGAQLVANLWINRWFAEGNLYLLAMQSFTIMQYVFMLMLVWNFEVYLYDLRLIRYLSLFWALLFVLGFVAFLGVELDLVYVIGAYNKSDNVFDVLGALFLGYNLVMLVPTFIISVIILGKEMTLNQFAWRKDQDFETAKIYNTVDMDPFDWFGISEDSRQYLEWLKKWGKEFL